MKIMRETPLDIVSFSAFAIFYGLCACDWHILIEIDMNVFSLQNGSHVLFHGND